MENQDASGPLVEEVVYGTGADGTFEFEDEPPIHVSRAIVAFHSSFFRKEFFGPEQKTKIKIKGFAREYFLLFLNCLFGLKDYTLPNALLIYPIAHRYEVKKSLDECAAALKTNVIDKNVSLAINHATLYGTCDVSDHLINLIKTKYGVVNFIENENYSDLLQPSALCKLIENVKFNSLVWTLLYRWGKNYLKLHYRSDVADLFKDIGIFEKISLSHFESVKAIIDFHEMSDMKLLRTDEIFSLIGKNIMEPEKILPDKSHWIKIDPGHSLKETILFKNEVWIGKNSPVKDLHFIISPNNILIDAEVPGLIDLKIEARYIFRRLLRNDPQFGLETYRSDLNFFYREKFSDKEYFISVLSPSDRFDVNVNFVDDSKMPVYKFFINTKGRTLDIHALEITYNFNSPCRILKASLNMTKYSSDENNLYFTKNVTIAKANAKDQKIKKARLG